MKYEVVTVDTDAMPGGMHTLIVERDGADPLLLIAGDVAEAWGTMRSWEDTIEPSWQPTVTIPASPLRLVV